MDPTGSLLINSPEQPGGSHMILITINTVYPVVVHIQGLLGRFEIECQFQVQLEGQISGLGCLASAFGAQGDFSFGQSV